jgi:hypothetical protein
MATRQEVIRCEFVTLASISRKLARLEKVLAKSAGQVTAEITVVNHAGGRYSLILTLKGAN